ncbi:hypothetical protein RJT34_22393 [Clitoria ternatea]|uniref:Uncharacterized protein n=1 Tax=Clitoria ternatea TaxID=43366 RepID=A0AAN9P6A7_CLITE
MGEGKKITHAGDKHCKVEADIQLFICKDTTRETGVIEPVLLENYCIYKLNLEISGWQLSKSNLKLQFLRQQ